jgi:hypothetical protein
MAGNAAWGAPAASSGSSAMLIVFGVLAIFLVLVIVAGGILFWLVNRATSRRPAAGAAPPAVAANPWQPQDHAAPQNAGNAPADKGSANATNNANNANAVHPNANGAIQIELSDARASTQGIRKGFSVSYKFTSGRPQPGVWLHWVIQSPDGHKYVDQLHHFDLGTSVTLSGTAFDVGGGARGPFEMWIEMGSPSPFAQRTVVSNTITASEAQIADASRAVDPNAPPDPLEAMRRAQEDLRQQRERMMEEQRRRLEEMRNRNRPPGVP